MFAHPQKVLGIDGRRAQVESKGKMFWVDICMISDVSVGDYILAHGELAIQKLEKKDALETIRALEGLENGTSI